MKQPLKILTSPVREPYWKLKGFGLKKYHFAEAERIRFQCDWKLANGEYMFPNYLEIDSRKVYNLAEFNKNLEKKDRYIVPWDQCDIGDPVEGRK